MQFSIIILKNKDANLSVRRQWETWDGRYQLPLK